MSVSFDGGSGRLLVEDVILQGALPNSRSKRVVSMAHLVDAGTGRVASSTLIKRYSGIELPGTYGGGTAADTGLHHGFVIDPYGFGVMLDTATGGVLSRFRVNEPASVNIETNLAVVDGRTHRLFLGVLPNSKTRSEQLLEILNTRTGKKLGYVSDRWGLLTMAVALNRLSDRIFVAHLEHNLVVVSGRSGRVVARPRVGEQTGGLAVDDHTGHVFVTSRITLSGGEQNTALWMLDASGRVLRGPMLGKLAGGVQLVADGTAGRLGMVDGSGNVKLLDIKTLRLRRTYILQNDTLYGIAVDEQTHRFIIGGHGGTTLLDSNG
jgi:DNA-binding beta-propeller fold protein YncE